MILTLEQAEDLAARTLAAIDAAHLRYDGSEHHYAADRERVASDLALVHVSWEWMTTGPNVAAWDYVNAEAGKGLSRTAALYGVTP